MLLKLKQTALILAMALVPLAAQAANGPLTTPAALGDALDGAQAPVVLDIRAPGAYARGHIPGARNAPYGLFRGPADNPGQLVTEAHLTEVFAVWALRPARPSWSCTRVATRRISARRQGFTGRSSPAASMIWR